MSPSRSLVTVAILQAALSLVELVATLPVLARGSPQLGQGGPSFYVGVLFIIFAVSGLFAAYGVWMNQKWGKVLTIIVRAVYFLFGLGDFLMFPDLTAKLIASIYLIVSVLIVYLVLRPQPKPATA